MSDEIQLQPNSDYIHHNNIIEFKKDIFDPALGNDQSIYCKSTPIIDTNIYTNYGALLNILDYNKYDFDNVSRKAAINTLLKSLQNSSDINDYERALNVYYGLPISPDKCKVLGLYESYGYKISDVYGNNIILIIQDNKSLHNFIQVGTRLRVERTGNEVIVTNIVNRQSATIAVNSVSDLLYTDVLYIKLQNKFNIVSIQSEDEINGPFIIIKSNDSAQKIQHLINITQDITYNKEYPEIIIYGTEMASKNFNGIYHMTLVEDVSPGLIKIHLYNYKNNIEPKYNDFICDDNNNMDCGFAHIHWPTHKFLLLLLNNENYYKAYIDTPLDSIYDDGDFLNKYDIICRNVSVINSSIFNNWNEFDGFRKNNKLDLQSCFAEIVAINSIIDFGSYFPSSFESL